MMINPNSNKSDHKKIEDIAKGFASKAPKETNYNNIKSRKYFGSSSSGTEESGTATLKDTLLYSIHSNSISTTNKNDSIIVQMKGIIFINIDLGVSYSGSHNRTPSNILRVSKNIVSFDFNAGKICGTCLVS